MDLASSEVAGELERAHDPGVLGDVVGLDAEILRDRGVGDGAVIARVGPAKVEERGTERRRTGVATRRTVRPDDEAARSSLARRPLLGLARELGEERIAQSDA